MTMPSLKQKLRKALENAERVAILGIGSELRGDDAVGLLVLDHLQKMILKRKKVGREPPAPPKNKQWRCEDARALPVNKSFRPSGPNLKLFNGGTAPENLTGEIRRFKPGHLIMIDAVDMKKKPGTVALLDLKKIENTAFLTHKLPLKLMLDYLAGEAPHGLPRGNPPLADRVFAKPCDLSAIAQRATAEAKTCGNLRRQGYGGQGPQGFLAKEGEMNFTAVFIGIQPRSLDFGVPISKPVIRAGRELAGLLFSLFF